MWRSFFSSNTAGFLETRSRRKRAASSVRLKNSSSEPKPAPSSAM